MSKRGATRDETPGPTSLPERKRYRREGELCGSAVHRAKDTSTNAMVALKVVELDQDGVPSRGLREVALLRQLSHGNVVRLLDVYLDPPDALTSDTSVSETSNLVAERRLELVFESLDQDLCKYLEESAPQGPRLPMVRSFLQQILQGLAYCHSRGVMHRCLQPKNLLIDRRTGTLKITGFGLARSFQVPVRTYSHEVVCLWYRAPEILLGERQYATPVDVWSVGVILAEMLNNAPLWPGDSEVDELCKIFTTLGTPSEALWPGVSALPDFSLRFPHWPPVSVRAPRRCEEHSSGIYLLQQPSAQPFTAVPSPLPAPPPSFPLTRMPHLHP